ncbi:MAG: SbcC/MukB-like Walker B domain-containing protein, partial [Clostridiaceae bacterium]|nr:SbcC/MukB-like Walker B domain-containing protein [Clostridiaceae bacterium]
AIAAQKSKLEEALEKAAKHKIRTETLKVEASCRDKIQKGAALEEELERLQKIKEQQKARYQELLNIINQQEQELGAMEKSGIELCNGMEAARASYEQHNKEKQWDRNDLLKAETKYYSIKSVTDSLKLKYKDTEQLELRISDFNKQIDVLEKRINGLCAEKENKLKELDTKRLLLDENKKEQERNTAFNMAQNLRNNEPCPVCGATSHPCPAAYSEGTDPEAGIKEMKELQIIIDKLDLELRAKENEGIKLDEKHNNLRSQKEALTEDKRIKQEEQTELLNRLPEDYQGLSIKLIEDALNKMSEEKQERLKTIEEWEKKLAELEEKQKKIGLEYNRYQVESSGKRSQLEANREHLEDMNKAYTEAEETCSTRKGAYDSIVRDIGISSIRVELQRIQRNDREAESLYRELQAIENSAAELRKEIEKAEGAKKLDMEKLSENTAEGRGFKYQKEEKEKELHALLGDKDIKTEISKTEEEMAALAKEEQKAQEYVNTVRERYEKVIKDKKVNEKQRDIFAEKLRNDTEMLEKELEDKGFESVESVEGAFMPKEKLAEQERAIKEYEDASSSTKAHKAVIERKLSGRSITEELWQQTSCRYEELKLEKENSIAAYESAKNKFETIKSNYDSWLALGKELQEYSRKKEHLELVKNLLKGNGFIEYISEERLRYIAKEASETLGTLTGHRYGLELDTENGFVIRDDANGGMRRLVTTLSGGETFLTSLALALALSSQIQLKGQSPLEFFFLDEGFGTLDSSLLDTVIDSLERLSTKERVIGLISHVPELRSRITRRLVVEAPVFNGTGSRVYMEKA